MLALQRERNPVKILAQLERVTPANRKRSPWASLKWKRTEEQVLFLGARIYIQEFLDVWILVRLNASIVAFDSTCVSTSHSFLGPGSEKPRNFWGPRGADADAEFAL